MAGRLEGQITHDLIAAHFKNTVGDDFCKGLNATRLTWKRSERFTSVDTVFCQKLQDFLQKNLNYMNRMIDENRSTDPYWHQIGLILEQTAGLQDGYENPKKEISPHRKINLFGLYIISLNGDLEDLEPILKVPQDKRRRVLGSGSCSALIKVLPNNTDLFTAQVTWSDYASMLRIQKHYDLKYHLFKGSNDLIPGFDMTLSSYPGSLPSGDDFYVMNTGLVSQETTIGNNNKTLYESIKGDQVVLEWIRSLVANRLAKSGPEWANFFSIYNSGTYNNQWMIVDYKLFKPNATDLADNLLTIVEQIPTLIMAADATNVLRKQSYFPSYNTPYFPVIFNMSGSNEMVSKYGDWFTYDKTPRAMIFKRDHSTVKDLTSMLQLMRYNNFRSDPLSKCNCQPLGSSAENAISARNDLNPINGSYPFAALSHRSHGATDAKITSYDMVKRMQFLAVSGPTFNDVDIPPFEWSKSDFVNKSHLMHPDLFVFEPLIQDWVLTDSVSVQEQCLLI